MHVKEDANIGFVVLQPFPTLLNLKMLNLKDPFSLTFIFECDKTIIIIHRYWHENFIYYIIIIV